ncbi:MAG: hypothetical protein WDN24_13120 [Sphingomonas sp.]
MVGHGTGRRSRFLLLLVLAAGLRLSIITRHFGNVDDLGVAATILDAERHPPDSAALIAEARRKQANGHGTPRTAALLRFTRSPAARAAIDTVAPAFPFVAVPLTWTYAPLPFVATPLLIAPGQGYEAVKLGGRLPSTLFALGAMLLMVPLARRLRPADPLPLALATVALLGFSRELIVMSVQMHGYAATVFAAAAILLLTAHDVARPEAARGWRFVAARGALMLLFCYLSYQSVMLLPGYLAALAWASVQRAPRREWIRRLLPATAIGAAFVAAIVPAYLYRLSTIRAVTWNAGPNNEFLFAPNGIGDAIASLPGFLAGNGWLTFEAMTTPLTPDGWPSRILTALVLAAAAAGLAAMIRRARRGDGPERDFHRALLVHIGVTFALLLAFVVTARLALAPTRHMLLYLPLLAMCFGIGVLAVARRIGEGLAVKAGA